MQKIALPGGPVPETPISREPVLGFDLERFALASAALAEAASSRREVLSAWELTEATWLAVEQTWLLRLATGALRGDHELLQAHEAATSGRAAPVPDVPLDVCASILAAAEQGRGMSVALRRARLSPAAWARVEVLLRRRAAREPAFQRELRAALEAERRGKEA